MGGCGEDEYACPKTKTPQQGVGWNWLYISDLVDGLAGFVYGTSSLSHNNGDQLPGRENPKFWESWL